jgi:hypothetical protein
MRYYLTTNNGHDSIDIWKDHPSQTNHVFHYTNLKGGAIHHYAKTYTFDCPLSILGINHIIQDESEDLEQLLINATIYAL